MNKEYTSTHIEYLEVPNYIEPKERMDGEISEYFKALDEYTAYGKEYVDSIESEIEIVNSNSSKTNEKEQKKKKQKKNMLQNMVYTVASVATVLVLTQTAEPDKFVRGSYLSQIVSEQKDSIAENIIVLGGNNAEANPNYDEDENNTKDDNNAPNDNFIQDKNKPNKVKGNKLSFEPSDITFMGYPVTVNHYEEWKAALNFSGNDQDFAQCVDRDNEFCDELVCKLKDDSNNCDYFICLYDMSDYKSFLIWNQQGSMYVFVLSTTSNWSHIGKQYLSCPFYIGQTFDEALQAAGYTGEITFDNNPISISEDITIIGSTSDMKWVSFYFKDIGQVDFAGTDNIIEYIVVSSYAH